MCMARLLIMCVSFEWFKWSQHDREYVDDNPHSIVLKLSEITRISQQLWLQQLADAVIYHDFYHELVRREQTVNKKYLLLFV